MYTLFLVSKDITITNLVLTIVLIVIQISQAILNEVADIIADKIKTVTMDALSLHLW